MDCSAQLSGPCPPRLLHLTFERCRFDFAQASRVEDAPFATPLPAPQATTGHFGGTFSDASSHTRADEPCKIMLRPVVIPNVESLKAILSFLSNFSATDFPFCGSVM